MIKFRDILQEAKVAGQTIKLYRGDPTPVEKYMLRKFNDTDWLGQGIWLTDNPDIALNYSGGKFKKVAVERKNGKPTTRIDAIKDFAWDEYGKRDDYNDDDMPKMPSGDFKSSSPQYKKWDAAIDKWMEQKMQSQEYKSIIEPLLNDTKRYRVVKTGSESGLDYWKIEDMSTVTGAVTTFNVQVSLISRCYNCDQPIDEELKNVLVHFDSSPIMQKIIADDIKKYKTLVGFCSHWGVHYHAKDFRQYFIKKGYVGLTYDGSKALNQYDNGIPHNVYVFWNISALNKMRDGGAHD